LRPVFISGLYRSGTTVLTRVFDQSDQLKITYDTIHFMRFSYNNYLPIEQSYINLVRDTHTRLQEKWSLKFNAQQVINAIEKNSVITQAVVYHELMKDFLHITDLDVNWGEKTNVVWENIPGFLEMFPKGRVLHIYRDPRAVLASYRDITYHPQPMYLDAIFCSLAMFNFIEKDEIKNERRVFFIKYEDFVDKPEKSIKEICTFLEIDFHERMLDVKSFRDFYGKTFDTDSSFTGQKEHIDTSSVHLWREKLTQLEIYLTEWVLREKLLRFGYELSGVDLSKKDFEYLYDILHTDFLYKRYAYWLKNGDGVQAYPDNVSAYLP